METRFLYPSVRQGLTFPAAFGLEPTSSSSSLAKLSSIPPPFSSYWPFPLPPSPKLPRLVACFLQQPMGCQSACADSNGGSGQRLGARFGGRVEKEKKKQQQNPSELGGASGKRSRRRSEQWQPDEGPARLVSDPFACRFWLGVGPCPQCGERCGAGAKKQRPPLRTRLRLSERSWSAVPSPFPSACFMVHAKDGEEAAQVSDPLHLPVCRLGIFHARFCVSLIFRRGIGRATGSRKVSAAASTCPGRTSPCTCSRLCRGLRFCYAAFT